MAEEYDLNMDPQTSYRDDILLHAGTNNAPIMAPNKICIGRNPRKQIDMVERIGPLAKGATPPEVRMTTVLLNDISRRSRATNILKTREHCNGGYGDHNPICFELNPWGRGQSNQSIEVGLYHARNELAWCWINPTLKLSLQRGRKTDGHAVEPDQNDPLSHKTVPLSLDPQCHKMQPFGWNTFDGIPIDQFVCWDPDNEYWVPTFDTSEDMMKAIHAYGIQRDGEEEAEYQKIHSASNLHELPISIFQITTMTFANILARRTFRRSDGMLTVAERPIPQVGMRIEWFIPEFDNLDPDCRNRQLEPWYLHTDRNTGRSLGWKRVELEKSAALPGVEMNAKKGKGVQYFYRKNGEFQNVAGGRVNTTDSAAPDLNEFGHPSEWRWRFTQEWLARWDTAKHDKYRGEHHHELLFRPVEPNADEMSVLRSEKKMKAILEISGSLVIGVVPAKNTAKSLAKNRVFSDREIAPLIQTLEKWEDDLAKTRVPGYAGPTATELRREGAIVVFKLLEKLRQTISRDVADEKRERERRTFAIVSKLSDSMSDESDWFIDFLRH